MKQPEVSKQPEAAGAAPELIVFSILRASQCSQCKTKLESGSFLTLEKGQPLCMICADVDHLVFLPRGDTALTLYDKLLMQGLDRSEARVAVEDKIEEVLSSWENPEASNR